MAIALVCACAIGPAFGPVSAVAKDVLLNVELDGRPLDAGSPSAILHGGKAMVNVVRVTKAFSGLLTFGRHDSSVRVTIRSNTAQFVIGRRAGTLNGQPATFPAPPFILYGDTFVPLATLASLAGATLSVDTRHRVARLTSAPEAAAP